MTRKMVAATLSACFALLLQGCSGGEPVSEDRYLASDQFIATIRDNVDRAAGLANVVDIDHSRLGHDAGSPMPPAQVLLFSDPEHETRIIQSNPLAALDLPFRVLAFEPGLGQKSRVIYNSFDYIASRYGLGGSSVAPLRAAYDDALAAATEGIPAPSLAEFADDNMQPDGIVTLDSPYDFEQTVARVRAAIEAQDDTVYFGTVDFQANAAGLGVDIPASYMILFGGPGPGGKAMAKAPTLGLDGFCQKFLIWEDRDGSIHLSFNDLLELADRQQVPKSLALRVIDFRLGRTFRKALAED